MDNYIVYETHYLKDKLEKHSEWLGSLKFDKNVISLHEHMGLTDKEVNDLLKSIGVYKVIHNRNTENVDYKTLLVGKKESVIVEGLFTSGYGGGGPSRFARALKELNVQDDIINEHILTKYRGYKNTIITILKSNLSDI